MIKATNGREYEVLEVNGDYTLLFDITNPFVKEFIVAHNLKENEQGLFSWNFGKYFYDDILGAAKHLASA